MKLSIRQISSWVFLLLIPALIILVFTLQSASLEGPGFPLDDAWIHQTYARNLVQEGNWSFQAGRPSAGSTSPLWTLLLTPGHGLAFSPWSWVLILGWLSLVALGFIQSRWLGAGRELAEWQLGLVGSAVALEWHVVWAGLSGMETLLAGLVALLFLWLMLNQRASGLILGILIGVGVWLRPDLLSLVVAAGWYWLFTRDQPKAKLKWLLALVIGVIIVFIPYLLMQKALSGSFWPSTFYAKQAEYAVLRSQPWLLRFAQQFTAPLAGPLSLLLPGVMYWTWIRVRQREWKRLAPLLWVIIYLATFATRLPVTYQHGRYAMPVIPTLFVLGSLGLLDFLHKPTQHRFGWVIRRAWPLATLVVGLLFTGLGARAYARDVAIIESEMVTMSRWISENTSADSLIAAHDIGALGYYGERRILDLAGLISAEVIPIIRQEQELAGLMDARSANYLMTFPDWYPQLVDNLVVVHSTGSRYSPQSGGTNMTLYQW